MTTKEAAKKLVERIGPRVRSGTHYAVEVNQKEHIDSQIASTACEISVYFCDKVAGSVQFQTVGETVDDSYYFMSDQLGNFEANPNVQQPSLIRIEEQRYRTPKSGLKALDEYEKRQPPKPAQMDAIDPFDLSF